MQLVIPMNFGMNALTTLHVIWEIKRFSLDKIVHRESLMPNKQFCWLQTGSSSKSNKLIFYLTLFTRCKDTKLGLSTFHVSLASMPSSSTYTPGWPGPGKEKSSKIEETSNIKKHNIKKPPKKPLSPVTKIEEEG